MSVFTQLKASVLILLNGVVVCLPSGFHAPRLVTIENCMKLTQMIVQGLQESKSPLLQLPHFEEEHLRYCISKKVTADCARHSQIILNISLWHCCLSRRCHVCPPHQYKVRSLQDLVSLKDSDRRSMLRALGEEKYDEVMAVLGSFPHITMDIKLQGGPCCDTTVRWLNVLQQA